MSKYLLEKTIHMFADGAVVTVRVDEQVISIEFDTRSCIMLSHMFGKDSSDAIRTLGHALILAADTVDAPTKQ